MGAPEASVKLTAANLTDPAFRAAGRNLHSFSQQAVRLGGVLTGISGVVLFKNIFENTARAEKALAQLDARLKSTGGAAGFSRNQLVEMSKGLQQVSTFGDDAIQEMQALLLQFTNLKGPQFQAAQESILNISTALGVDLASAAKQVGKALNDPAQGMSALSRMGVQFSDSQENVIKKLAETGHTAEAQKIILQELEEKFGGAARAARNTFGGALTALKEAAGDLLEADSLGGTQKAVEELTKNLQDPKTVEAAQKLTNAIIAGFTEAVKVLAQIPNFMEFLGEATAKFVGGSADPIERIDENIGHVSERLVELKNIIQSSGQGGFLPPNITEEFDQLTGQMEELRKQRAQLVKDVENSSAVQRPGGAVPASAGAPGVSGIIGGSAPVLGVTDDKITKELEKIQEGLRTKEEMIIADFARQNDFIVANMGAGAARDDLLERLAEKHQKELTRIQNEGLTQREKFERMSSANKVKSLLNDAVQMTQGVASNNKKMFQLNKNLALAQAVVALPSAVIQSFENAGGYPWGLIPAGLMLITGLARIAEIRSASYGGGGGSAPSLAGMGGGGSTTNTVPVAPQVPNFRNSEQQANQRTVSIVISGPVDRQYLRDALLPALQEEINENDVVFMNSGSAQARELRRA